MSSNTILIRKKLYYEKYHQELKFLNSAIQSPLILSLHSFAPNAEEIKQKVEIDVLYDKNEKQAIVVRIF